MATANPSLAPSNSTDALFRAWIASITTNLAAFGLVQTADTGQINTATVLAPTVVNTKQGYQIWRFADALQATAPVFFKLSYGSGGAAAATPAIWVQVGTGSDGAGTLTGQISVEKQLSVSSTSTTPAASPMSGTAGRVSLAIFGGSASAVMCVNIERTKDSAGADTATGVIFQAAAVSLTLRFGQYIPATGIVPAASTALGAGLPGGYTSMSTGADVHLVPTNPWIPAIQPGMGFLVYFNADLTAANLTPVTIYGAAHTYYPLGTALGLNSAVSGFADSTLAIRFE